MKTENACYKNDIIILFSFHTNIYQKNPTLFKGQTSNVHGLCFIIISKISTSIPKRVHFFSLTFVQDQEKSLLQEACIAMRNEKVDKPEIENKSENQMYQNGSFYLFLLRFFLDL